MNLIENIDYSCFILQSWVNNLCSCLESLRQVSPFCVLINTQRLQVVISPDSGEPIEKQLFCKKNFSWIFICIYAKSHLHNIITDKNLFNDKYNNWVFTCKGNILFEKKYNGNKMIYRFFSVVNMKIKTCHNFPCLRYFVSSM